MSSIPAVKAKLVEILDAALPNTEVIYGPFAAVTDEARLLTVGRALGSRDLDSLSLATTAEQYTIELMLTVDLMASSNQQEADEQALAGYGLAEAAIREYAGGPALGIGGTLSVLPTGEFELTELADSNGRHAAVRFYVSVYAQNT